jgi:hypothetical protein
MQYKVVPHKTNPDSNASDLVNKMVDVVDDNDEVTVDGESVEQMWRYGKRFLDKNFYLDLTPYLWKRG